MLKDSKSRNHIKALRRKIVSSSKARGMSDADIAVLLEEEEVLNPDTGEPYSVSTIAADSKIIEDEWQETMMQDITLHRARVLAELRELKASAWNAGKLSIVSRAIDQEVDLLGLNKLERLSLEIAIANLFKGMPKEIAEQLKGVLSEKVAEKKAINRRNSSSNLPRVIDINRVQK